MASIFEVNEEGYISYKSQTTVPDETPVITPVVTPEPTPVKTPEPTPELNESESVEDGNVADQPIDEGDILQSPEVTPETEMEVEEEAPALALPLTDDGYMPVVLAEEVTAAILGQAPASGSIASGTLDYFDRIVSGLPQDYVYIAYRNNSDDSNDAVLYFGKKYDVDGNTITFGADAMEIIVDRVTQQGYQAVTNYYSGIAAHTSIDFNQNGAVIYYTNAAAGFPVLGGYEADLSYSPFIVGALVCAFATVVISKLIKG